MKNLLIQSKSIVLVTLLLLGINTAISSIVITGYQNFWTSTCNIYSDSGFWCENNSIITTHLVTGIAVLGVGYLLLVKWLQLTGVRRLILIALTYVLLLLIFTHYQYNHLHEVNASGEDYLNSGFAFFVNWSNGVLSAFISSLWFLIPVQKIGTVKKKK